MLSVSLRPGPMKRPPTATILMRALASLLTALVASTGFAGAALAGPSFTGIDSTRIQGAAQFNTSYGETFSAKGNTTADVQPFNTTTGLAAGPGGALTAAAPTNVGNVGTAVLAVTFLQDGVSIAGDPDAMTPTGIGPQVQSTSGIIQLGGGSTIGGSSAFNTPSALILNQNGAAVAANPAATPPVLAQNAGIKGILLSGSDIGASINATQVGTTSLSSDVTIVNQLINSLTAF